MKIFLWCLWTRFERFVTHLIAMSIYIRFRSVWINPFNRYTQKLCDDPHSRYKAIEINCRWRNILWEWSESQCFRVAAFVSARRQCHGVGRFICHVWSFPRREPETTWPVLWNSDVSGIKLFFPMWFPLELRKGPYVPLDTSTVPKGIKVYLHASLVFQISFNQTC